MKIFLESDRLYLRRINTNDLDQLIQLDTDPEILRYIGNPKSRDESIQRMQKALDEYESDVGLGKWMAVEKSSGEDIGWFVLNELDQTEWIEIGYRILKNFWGKGYATEMSGVLLEYGFESLGLEKIVGITHPDNEASKRVLQKIGLQYVGRRKFYQQNVAYFEINKEDDLIT